MGTAAAARACHNAKNCSSLEGDYHILTCNGNNDLQCCFKLSYIYILFYSYFIVIYTCLFLQGANWDRNGATNWDLLMIGVEICTSPRLQ
jgi:hypothetical protein